MFVEEPKLSRMVERRLIKYGGYHGIKLKDIEYIRDRLIKNILYTIYASREKNEKLSINFIDGAFYIIYLSYDHLTFTEAVWKIENWFIDQFQKYLPPKQYPIYLILVDGYVGVRIYRFNWSLLLNHLRKRWLDEAAEYPE